MSSFNLKKYAAQHFTPYEKMLQQNNSAHNLSADDEPGTTNFQLQKKVHKGQDATRPFESQLDSARTKKTGDRVTEKAINDESQLFNERRRDRESNSKIGPVQLLAEGFDQKKLRAFRDAEKKDKREKAVWDKLTGTQMEGKKTKAPANLSGKQTQLQNHPDRFKNLDKTQPVSSNVADNAKATKKKNNIGKLVAASLKDADAILFDIFAKAATENRQLNETEQQMVKDVNAAKTHLLAKGLLGQQKSTKTAQDDGDYGYEPYEDDYRSFEDQQAWEDSQSDMMDDYEDEQEEADRPYITIEPAKYGSGVNVYEWSVYEDSSVLHGQEKKTFLDQFDSVEDALAAYPDASVEDSIRPSEADVPQQPEDWFDPLDAGEAWGENDY